MPSFYQVLFHILDHGGIALNRFDPGGEYPAFQNEEHPAAGTAVPVQQYCCAPGADEFADPAAPGLAAGQTERGFYDAGARLKAFSKFSLQTFPWIMSRS